MAVVYVLLILIVSVLVVAITVPLTLRALRRRLAQASAVATWARSHGWSFAYMDTGLPMRFPSTPAVRAQGQLARNVLSGTVAGQPAVMFDCTVSTEHGGGFYAITLLAVSLPAPVPALSVSREDRRDRAARDLGVRDIEFENDDFNRRFKVESPSRSFASDVLNPRMIDYLLASNGPDWQLTGHDLVCWHAGTLSPGLIEADLSYAEGLMTNIPRFVWEKATGSA